MDLKIGNELISFKKRETWFSEVRCLPKLRTFCQIKQIKQKTIFCLTCLRERGPYGFKLGQEFSLYTLNEAGGWAPVRRISCVIFFSAMKLKMKFILF